MGAQRSERDYWDRQAKNYGRVLKFLARPVPRMVELAAEAVHGAERVLEVAAGPGPVTLALADVAGEVIATDYSSAMVTMLEQHVAAAGLTNVRCEQADIYALRFDSGTFDAVVATNVLHVVPDLPGALAALRRILKPGGRLVAPTFCHGETALSQILSRIFALTGFPGYRRFNTQSLRSALESAGLRVTRAETLPGPIPIGYVEGTFETET